jgi:hypothetical protein
MGASAASADPKRSIAELREALRESMKEESNGKGRRSKAAVGRAVAREK